MAVLFPPAQAVSHIHHYQGSKESREMNKYSGSNLSCNPEDLSLDLGSITHFVVWAQKVFDLLSLLSA